jgi:hypothetical protein
MSDFCDTTPQQNGWKDVEFCDMLKTTCNAIILVTTCNGCIVLSSACVTFFFAWDKFAFYSLFYGKCYVTMFVRELLHSPIAIGENFVLKMRRNCLESIFFFFENVGFYFCLFPSFFESIFFFLEGFFFATFYIFFGRQMNLTDFVGFAIYFFS